MSQRDRETSFFSLDALNNTGWDLSDLADETHESSGVAGFEDDTEYDFDSIAEEAATGLDSAFEDEDEAPPSRSRRAVAERTRAYLRGLPAPDEQFEAGFARGYAEALRSNGAPEEKVSDTYGSLMALVGSGLLAAGKKFVVPVLQDPAFRAGIKQAGQGAKAALSKTKQTAEVLPAAIEAGKEDLPPVYVSDNAAVSEDVSANPDTFGSLPMQDLPVEDTFGTAVKYGFIGKFSRSTSRDAARKAVFAGQHRLREHAQGEPQALQEDDAAEPVLLRDGSIVEPVYGQLHPVPCPSCNAVGDSAARMGAVSSCEVCDGFGAILIPDSDIDDYGSSYGLMFLAPFLVSQHALAKEKEKSEKLKKKLKREKEEAKSKEEKEDHARSGRARPTSSSPARPSSPASPATPSKGVRKLGPISDYAIGSGKNGSSAPIESVVDQAVTDVTDALDAELDTLDASSDAEVDYELEGLDNMGSLSRVRTLIPRGWTE